MLREWRLHVLSVFSLAVAFVCLGAALLTVTNLSAVQDRWAHSGRASVYLKDAATQEEIESLKRALAMLPAVTGIRYVSSSQARADFGQKELEGRPELAGLPQDAFPASLEVEIRPETTDAELGEIASKLRLLPSVDDVETYQAWTERLARLVRGGVAASALLALVVLSAVLAVVGSTVRMAMQRRRAEVEVLKLVGATDGFVKGPYLVEGTVQGALGALGAVGLLGVVFLVVRARLDLEFVRLIGVEPAFLPWPIALGMIALGAVLGMVAALASLRRMVSV
jgi:cell division transport system permease protein